MAERLKTVESLALKMVAPVCHFGLQAGRGPWFGVQGSQVKASQKFAATPKTSDWAAPRVRVFDFEDPPRDSKIGFSNEGFLRSTLK